MPDDVWAHGDAWTVAQLIRSRLESNPDGELFDVNGEQWTARTLVSAADRFANAMRSYGLAKGDRVATLVENSSEAVISQFGAVQLGGVSVPINTAYKGEFLRHQIADSGAKVLVIDGDVADRARAIADSIDTLDHVVVLGESGEFAESGATTKGTNWHTWSDVMAADDAPNAPDASPTDLYVFVYTGGTTGLSKGCVINHNYCVTLARQIANDVGARPRRRGVDAAAVVPLQRGVGRARRHAAHRRAGGDLPEVLGVELLARGQPDGRDAREHARQHGHARRERSRAPRSPRFGDARGEHHAAVHVGRADARRPSSRSASSASGSARSTPGTAPPRVRCGRGCRPGW